MKKSFHESWGKSSRAHTKRVATIKTASRHPFAVPFITFAVLITLTAIAFAIAATTNNLASPPDAKIVIISHDHLQQTVPSRDATVGSLLQKLHIQLNEGDVVEPTLASRIDQDQFRINIYRAVPVLIVDGAKKAYTFSAATTPRSIAVQANTTVFAEDAVSVDPVQNFVRSGVIGQEVTIHRSVPVNLNLYGTPLALRTHANTVGDLIKQKNIKLAKDDQVTPSQTTPLTPNTQVFVTRIGVKIESVTETIAMPVQTIQDPGLAYGTSAVRQQGSAGSKVTTYQNNLQNGIIVSRSLLQTVVTLPAVTQINVTGTSLSGIKGDMALAGIVPGDYNYADYIISHESGWCPTKWQGTRDCPGSFVPLYSTSSSFGYGLGQATPANKMAAFGSDWQTNPVTQLRWANAYAQGRGGWQAVYNYWLSHQNW